MVQFRKASSTRINAFPVEGRVYFKHYFDDRGIFGELSAYYNGEQYRFEIPMDALTDVREFLQDEGFGLVVVSDPAEFAVVKRKYTKHPDSLFKNSVLMRQTSNYHVFLMKNQTSLEQALINGARRLTAVDIDFKF